MDASLQTHVGIQLSPRPRLIVLTRRNTFQAFLPQIRYLLGLAILLRLSLSDSVEHCFDSK